MKMNAQRATWVVALSAVALLMSGCGRSSSGSPSPQGAASTSSPLPPASPYSPPVAEPTGSNTLLPTPSRVPLPPSPSPLVGDFELDTSLIPESTLDFHFAQARINGIDYSNALWMRTSDHPLKVEVDAARRQHRFRGSLGIPDDEKSSSVHQVDISLDNGPPTFSTLVSFGQTKDIDIDVTSVLRVRITVLNKGESCCGQVAIGNPRFS